MVEFELLMLVANEVTGISKEDLISKKRDRPLVELRIICSNVFKEYNKNVKIIKIGELLNVTHSTIVYYAKINKDLMFQNNGKYKALYEKIRSLYGVKLLGCRNRIKEDLVEKKSQLEKMLLDVNSVLNMMEKEEMLMEPKN